MFVQGDSQEHQIGKLAICFVAQNITQRAQKTWRLQRSQSILSTEAQEPKGKIDLTGTIEESHGVKTCKQSPSHLDLHQGSLQQNPQGHLRATPECSRPKHSWS